jgi:hypothetical protein
MGAGVGVGAVAGAPSSEGIWIGADGVSSEKMELGGRGEDGRIGERVVVSWDERRAVIATATAIAIAIAIVIATAP